MLHPMVANRVIERLDSVRSCQLTERELEVLQLLALGESNKVIARRLSLSANTVNFHIKNIYGKLDVHTRAQAVRVAGERGLVNA